MPPRAWSRLSHSMRTWWGDYGRRRRIRQYVRVEGVAKLFPIFLEVIQEAEAIPLDSKGRIRFSPEAVRRAEKFDRSAHELAVDSALRAGAISGSKAEEVRLAVDRLLHGKKRQALSAEDRIAERNRFARFSQEIIERLGDKKGVAFLRMFYFVIREVKREYQL